MDRRQRKTRSALFRALVTLLTYKPVSAITVQEIIDEADIGRATFYAHFRTKEHLLDALCEEAFAPLSADADSLGDTPDAVLLHLLQQLQRQDFPIRDLLCCQNSDWFLSRFRDSLHTRIRNEAARREWRFADDIPEDYVIHHITATVVETVRWWADSHPDRSPDVVAGYLSTAVRPLLAS